MNELKTLDNIFTDKIFRVPDYQRGYAWQKEHLKAFWSDLVNLAKDKKHYSNVITLQAEEDKNIKEDSTEFWLTSKSSEGSHRIYNVVDGQQRLTTCVILIQCFTELMRSLEENKGLNDFEIIINPSLRLSDIVGKYLYRESLTGIQDKTFIFGYSKDNPSYSFLKYKIFNEKGYSKGEETFYTLNLENAKVYFSRQLKGFYEENKKSGVIEIFLKLTKKFVFNEYIISEDFDVFVAFETMNNRGKKLSALELLKNRIIYLITLYPDEALDRANKNSLRTKVNETWQEIYHQLGKNKQHPLNDDDFLKAHWIMYFKYTRKRGNDYIMYLLESFFSSRRVNLNTISDIQLNQPEEVSEIEDEFIDDIEENDVDSIGQVLQYLEPKEINDYVLSLKESAKCWASTFYPNMNSEIDKSECEVVEALNRLGVGNFRPLLMSIFKNESETFNKIKIFKAIERFIFLTFRLSQYRSNYQDSVFYKVARDFDKKEITAQGVVNKLDEAMKDIFDDKNCFNTEYFENFMKKRFSTGEKLGFYGWHGLHYFLYEYELDLYKKLKRKEPSSWDILKNSAGDKISIEHICPQKANSLDWLDKFKNIPESEMQFYQGSIGNLLLLSSAINSGLQNDDFDKKKSPKFDSNNKQLRSGYMQGSHSEIEVSQYEKWSPLEVKARGDKLIKFMQDRWSIKFDDDPEKNNEIAGRFLFLPDAKNV